ncbi:MAG: hypothetical protein HGA36_00925 [Candidatus Moranbacteria bacterium]|nr:hypothetical protein [Candidatus Moranbacteria bacterium]
MNNQMPNGETQNSQTKDIKLSKKTRGIINIALLVFIIIVATNIFSKDEQKKDTVKQETSADKLQVQETKEQVPVAEKTQEIAQPALETINQPEIKIPKYEIVYEVSGKRYDGAKIYYVLIDPINLKDDSFKNDIKRIIKKIVEEKGLKISIDIFDKKTVLEASYGEASAQKIPTPKERTEAETHYIAMFSGELKTNIYPNALTFFGSTFTSNKLVGKYVETIEFNPSQY